MTNARFANDLNLAGVLGGQRKLSTGAKGAAVKAVQQSLLDMGFAVPGGADGSFGKNTADALRNFQVHAASQLDDVRPTGELDTPTMRALDKLAMGPGERGEAAIDAPSSYDGTPLRALVVKGEHRTFLFDERGAIADIFPNAVGAAGTATTAGLKKVTGKIGQKAAAQLGRRLWKSAGAFGVRIIDLSWADGRRSGEELHGTNKPDQLGQDVSHGCMRHLNQDILKLYDALELGDRVAVVDRFDDPHLGNQQSRADRTPSIA